MKIRATCLDLSAIIPTGGADIGGYRHIIPGQIMRVEDNALSVHFIVANAQGEEVAKAASFHGSG